MNEHLQAMQQLAAMRDAIVMYLFAASACVLGSVALLHYSRLPEPLRLLLVLTQKAVILAAFVVLIMLLEHA